MSDLRNIFKEESTSGSVTTTVIVNICGVGVKKQSTQLQLPVRQRASWVPEQVVSFIELGLDGFSYN